MTRDFSRQSFLGNESDAIFTRVKVGIIGLGGGGSHVAQQLAHIGVMNYVVIDPDVIDDSNLNRLVGGTAQDVAEGVLKVHIAERVIRAIDPSASIRPITGAWQSHQQLLRDRSVIFGCVDSFSEREQLERFCRRFLIPYIDIGMDVNSVGGRFHISGQVALSSPGAPCLRCMNIVTEDNLTHEATRYGAAGSRPQAVWPNGVLASTAIGLFVQLVTPWHDNSMITTYLEYNGNNHMLVPSPRLPYVLRKECPHYRPIDVGDPLYAIAHTS
jgi:molybdopterin/thiamine biosynthesis adenylyltransferase